MNNLKDITSEKLADMIGVADQDAKAAAEYLEKLKTEAKLRNLETISGSKFIVTVTTSLVTRLKLAELKLKFGKKLKPFEYTESQTTIRIKPVNPLTREIPKEYTNMSLLSKLKLNLKINQ